MITKILIYSVGLSTLFFLPDSLWEKLWQLCLRFYGYLKKFEGKNPFKKEQTQGEKLLVMFPDIEAKLALGIKTTSMELPRYKFYTTLLFDLLQVHRKLGISLKQILPELRLNLIKDLQFENKMISNVIGGNLQFLVITITTWGFIFLSSALAELPLHFESLMIILFIQSAGVLAFNGILSQMKNRIFLKFNQSIERLYLFVSLVEIGLPVGQVLSESKVMEGDLVRHKKFSQIANRLEALITRWKDNGISPKIESGEVIKELWHIKEVAFLQFLKQLDMLKFMVLAFFFLPAYFLYLYSIFKFFMES
ncbi:MAG: hypothetical protein H7336_14580 [Bacteriovorax sp.]|nr:hypothetical protein [Bacteriovorax sp.]